jgi:hypothetical protein
MNKETAISHWSQIVDLRKKGWQDKEIAKYLNIKIGDVLRISKTVFYSSNYSLVSNKKKKSKKKKKKKKIKIHDPKYRITGTDYVKQIVRKRDDNICRICGTKHVEGKRKMDVVFDDHEKTFGKEYVSVSEIDKLITVCHRCNLQMKWKIKVKSNKTL